MKRTIYECDACGSSKESEQLPLLWAVVTVTQMHEGGTGNPSKNLFCENCIQHVQYRAPEPCPFPDTIPQPEIAV
jgi:hypothetical protein